MFVDAYLHAGGADHVALFLENDRGFEVELVVAERTADRPGPRPTTSSDGPHRQLDQLAPPALWGELAQRVFALDGVVEGHSQVSPAASNPHTCMASTTPASICASPSLAGRRWSSWGGRSRISMPITTRS